jgi:hypothetical protein
MIGSPSCNVPLAFDVLQLLCDRGIPPLAGIDSILAQARLWRKLTQVLDRATRCHQQLAATVLKKPLAITAKLRTSITALCASLSTREVVFSLLSQLSLHRKPFLNLCQVNSSFDFEKTLHSCKGSSVFTYIRY